jgi:LuxR family transcriptional regulator, maltose regulon positive regulatory protein
VSSTVERPESGTAETGSRSTAVEWALLDERGVIVAVNDGWRSFSAQNGWDSRRTGVGMSYLRICDEAQDAVSTRIAEAVRSAITGVLPAPMGVRIPSDGPEAPTALDVLVSSRFDDGGRCVGATVTFSPVEDQPPAVYTVSDTKLHPPPPRSDWLDRPRLEQRLGSRLEPPVLLVVAPAGYGKSTLVAQWVARADRGSVAWVRLDPADNDPTRLWAHVAAALERVGCPVDVNVTEYVAMNSTAIDSRLVPRVTEALVDFARPLTIVLEDYHVVRSLECDQQLSLLIENLPRHVHLVMVSRSDPQLGLGRLRVEGRLGEIRTSDLAFTAEEAELLLGAQGITLSERARKELIQVTEGWPAAVYLAALYLRGRDDPEDLVAGLSGSNRFIAEYLSEEVLSRQTPEVREFILSMSVFDRFNTSLADHVTRSRSSARLLRQLERTNLFLTPLHGGDWYRFHHLFGSFARSALEVEDPERLAELHRRGAQWFAGRNEIELAVHHSMAAGDLTEAAALVQKNWMTFFDAGRSATVSAWMRALRGTPADADASATVAGAWIAALTGDRAELRRREAALAAMTGQDPLPDGTRSVLSALTLIRGLFGFAGPDRMLVDARQAIELEPDPSTPWHATASAALGHAAFVTGDVPLARAKLGEAARSPVAPLTVRILALGVLSLCEAEQGNSEASAKLAAQAMDLVTVHAMDGMPQALLASTAYGASLASSGRLEEAMSALAEGLRSRRRVPGLSPWPLIHHLMVSAAVSAQAGDGDLAEELLAEVEELAPWTDESMRPTRSRIAAVRQRLTRRPVVTARPGAALTPRERQILHRLRGTQTLREIAADLFVSHNTVKTLTLSLYRKLGVHSRAEVVALADSPPRP